MVVNKRNRILGIVFTVLLVLDQITKQLIVNRFQLGESVSVFPDFFNITYIRNTGAAFGILADTPDAFRIPFFFAIPLIALGIIVYTFKKLPPDDWRTSSALTMILSGAIGNLIDRVRFGYVVDFLDFHWKYESHYPAFNVADSAICVGVGLMLIDIFATKPNKDKNASHSV